MLAAGLGGLRLPSHCSIGQRGLPAHRYASCAVARCLRDWLGLTSAGSSHAGGRDSAGAPDSDRRRSCNDNSPSIARSANPDTSSGEAAWAAGVSSATDTQRLGRWLLTPSSPRSPVAPSFLVMAQRGARVLPRAKGEGQQHHWWGAAHPTRCIAVLQRRSVGLEGGRLGALAYHAVPLAAPSAGRQKQRERQTPSQLQRRLGQLQAFQAEHGHWMVPLSYKPENLGRWVNHMRKQYKRGRLPDELFIRLEAFGFTWDVHEQAWETKRQELQEFRRQHGHCRVPAHYDENPSLGHWVHRHRVERWKMGAERRGKLDALGFVWEVFSESWNQKVQQLRQFCAQHGHCVVPASYPDQDLTTWVYRQRQAMRQGQLDEQQVRTLSELGFVWDAHEAVWEEMCNQLKAFYAEHGNTLVPTSGSRLGAWVALQRRLHKSGKLEECRAQKLEDLGFVWNAQQAAWLSKYEKMVVFWKQHGHSAVPYQHQLWKWSEYQRARHRLGKLDSDRIELLDALGFPWGHISNNVL